MRTAIVTGASRGLGPELTRVLAARGYRLALVARDGEALEVVRREPGAADMSVWAVDLTDETSRSALIDDCLDAQRSSPTPPSNQGALR